MRNPAVKKLAPALWASLIALALTVPAHAGSLRQGSTGSSGAVTGQLPGEVLWAYYQTVEDGFRCPPESNGTTDQLCNTASNGDNIIRLINPNGAGNSNLAGARAQPVCAMIYVFDDDEEMGECCGCPLSSTQLTTISVEANLTANWGLAHPAESSNPSAGVGNGSIAIVAASPNTLGCVGAGGGKACNGGCDPTNVPGFEVTPTSNLVGSITHNQAVTRIFNGNQLFSFTSGIQEVPLFDDASGDPTNIIYLQTQCGALVGNGSLGGICTCPVE